MIIHSRKNQRLSLIVSKDSLSCFYIDVDTAEVLWNHVYDEGVYRMPEKSNELLKTLHALDSSRVFLFDDSERFTLIPNELYSWESECQTLELVVPLLDRERVATNRAARDLVCISEKSNWICDIQKSFTDCHCVHLTIPLINYVLEERNTALIYFMPDSFYLTVGKESLQFHNRFSFNTKDDVLYYLNSVSNHLIDLDTLIIAGLVTESSQLYHGIKSNFPNAKLYSTNLNSNQQMFFNL